MKTTNEIILQSLGPAETVRDSKRLLRTPELNILVDGGLFQGIKTLRMKNQAELPVHPGDIDVLLVTRAHLDHCGYIPLFVKKDLEEKLYDTSYQRTGRNYFIRQHQNTEKWTRFMIMSQTNYMEHPICTAIWLDAISKANSESYHGDTFENHYSLLNEIK